MLGLDNTWWYLFFFLNFFERKLGGVDLSVSKCIWNEWGETPEHVRLCGHAKLLPWHWIIARWWAEFLTALMVPSNHCLLVKCAEVLQFNFFFFNAVWLSCSWVRFRWIALRSKLSRAIYTSHWALSLTHVARLFEAVRFSWKVIVEFSLFQVSDVLLNGERGWGACRACVEEKRRKTK